MFLLVLEAVANNAWLQGAALVLQLVTMHVLRRILLPAAPVALQTWLPDYQMAGYQTYELQSWYDALGPDGCVHYVRVAMFDICAIMQAYTLLLGSLMVQYARAVGLSTRLALVFPAAMVFDLVETIIPAYGCQQVIHGHTKVPLDDDWIRVASAATQAKWCTLGVGLLLLSALFLYDTFMNTTNNDSVTTTTAPTIGDNNKKTKMS